MDPMIVSAEHITLEDLRLAMNSAFSDYAVPMQLTRQSFAFMLKQRGFDRQVSRIALVEGQIAAIWLVSLRGRHSYLVASGTDPMFRRLGMARRLAEDSIAHLRKRHTVSLQTEVLVENGKAYELYASLGMNTARTLQCFDIPFRPSFDAPIMARKVPWREIQSDVIAMIELEPSWQNDIASLSAVADEGQCWAISDCHGLVAYAVLLPTNNTLAQICVRKDRRQEGIGSSLLHTCQAGDTLRLLNVDVTSTEFQSFLGSVGAVATVRQFELTMEL
ncbi:GNAT family N-acetyltransferase [Ruegeria sp. R13_0]|uniref:GNAT family N-acetyltransferase n=1 Tax=Ruegeria sp. R13_0 TaxID=2821099 RepID=UPI001ADCBBFD|nr:GNAT family N-acetyltransferase [Ruegeria sp. R13_0]MBO9436378.1 GNAT family N-acetyltransferase [Ruegeria sp. R13_0]